MAILLMMGLWFSRPNKGLHSQCTSEDPCGKTNWKLLNTPLRAQVAVLRVKNLSSFCDFDPCTFLKIGDQER